MDGSWIHRKYDEFSLIFIYFGTIFAVKLILAQNETIILNTSIQLAARNDMQNPITPQQIISHQHIFLFIRRRVIVASISNNALGAYISLNCVNCIQLDPRVLWFVSFQSCHLVQNIIEIDKSIDGCSIAGFYVCMQIIGYRGNNAAGFLLLSLQRHSTNRINIDNWQRSNNRRKKRKQTRPPKEI